MKEYFTKFIYLFKVKKLDIAIQWNIYILLWYKRRLRLICLLNLKSDLIKNMDHMRIFGTEHSSVILSLKSIFKSWKKM